MRNLLLTLIILLFKSSIFAQLDTIHWFPPMHSKAESNIADHYMYLSTPEPTPFIVTITDGEGNILATPTISQGTPYRYTIGNGEGTKAFIASSDLNTVLSDKGLILSAHYKFYANFRVRSNVQAGSLTCKGNTARGTMFRVGVVPNNINNDFSQRNFCLSIMATKNNTTVTISDYDPGVEFFDEGGNITADILTFNLDSGQSYVVSGYNDIIANRQGFVGALVQSNNPIVINNGNLIGSIASASGQDIMIDQSVPYNQIGKKYILIRGNGTDDMERPLVIATEDNTKIYVNGETTPVATINAGEWFLIPESYYTGINNENMYVETTKNVYMYQPLGGTASAVTPGLNFIPPLTCFSSQSVDLIPDVDSIGTKGYNGGVFIYTKSGSNFRINGITQSGSELVSGNPEWETYKISGLTGDVVMESDGPMAVGFFGYSGAAGFAGYYSGFGDQPQIIFNGNYCEGDSVLLTLTSEYDSYLWNTGDTTSEIVVYSSGTYSVTVSNIDGCEDSTSFDVNFFQIPELEITGSDFCQGSSTELDAGTGFSDYIWSTGDTTHVIDITNGGTYSVTVTNGHGCIKEDSITVVENSLPSPNITGYDFCSGLPTTITTDSGYVSYLWNTGETSQSIVVNEGGSYTLSVVDNNGCQGVNSINIQEYPLPTPHIYGNNFCIGQNQTLTTDSGYVSYLWNTNSNSQSITISSGGTYSVTVTDSRGCSGSTSRSIVSYHTPIPQIIGDNFCEGSNSQLELSDTYENTQWSTGDTAGNIIVSTPGVYTVTVTDVNGCEGIDSIQIIEHPNPTPEIIGNTDVCEDESGELHTQYNYAGYIWSTGSNNSSIIVNEQGNYSVTVTDTYGCQGEATVVFTQHNNPTPEISGILFLCNGENTVLDAGSDYDSYHWNTSATSQSISVGTAGTYSVTVTDVYGCKGVDTKDVTVDEVQITTSGDKFICKGSETTISASLISGVYPVTYEWNTGATDSYIIINPDTNTYYSVKVTDALGCESSEETINIIVSDDVKLTSYINRDSVCPGDPVLITNSIEGGLPPYILTNNSGEIVSSEEIIYPGNTCYYEYNVEDACGSKSTSGVTINVYPLPQITIQSDKIEGCAPLEVQFTSNIDNSTDYIYSWTFGINSENNVSTSVNPIHIFEQSGTYDISLNVTTKDGCLVNQTQSKMIKVHPIPIARFIAKPEIVSIVEPLIYFENLSEQSSQYLWSFGDGDSSIDCSPVHKYTSLGYYNVSLISINEYGCKDTVKKSVRVDDVFTLYVPTAFTPDGDGINDYFYVKSHGVDTDNYILRIYDRWGEKIWETENLFSKWDGRVLGGSSIVQNGTYTWLIVCKDYNGKEHTKAGAVTVIR